MQILRIHDPLRRPPHWTDIVKPGQFVAFSTDTTTGVSCDADGRAFASAPEASLLVFDALEDARAFCEHRVTDLPSIQFDLYDSDGKANSPLMTIVNAARAATRDEHPRAFRRRRLIAIGLTAFAVVFLILGYLMDRDGAFVLPWVLGISLFVAAGRLLCAVTAPVTRRDGCVENAIAKSPLPFE